jgi:osmotically-inducible protein OsmY
VRDLEPVKQNDSEIRQAIKAAFGYDPRLVSQDIKVMVENGIVTLTGNAANILEKKAASDDAGDTVGVLRVINMIKVQPRVRVSDDEITKNIEAAFAKSRYVTESQVDVSVLLGRVFLSGTVESFFEKDKAAELAAKQKGVVDIANNIEVYLPQPKSADWEILQDIRTELRWSPFVDASRIEVSVKDGTAYLSGEVNNVNERTIAEKNAHEGGAKDVIDYLKVKDNPNF